jgi:hypothetical protein
MIFSLDPEYFYMQYNGMPSPSPSGALLHAFDAEAAALLDEREATIEAGRFEARREVLALGDLAKAIARAASEWRDLVAPLELASPYDPTRAGDLILETVFDEVLDPAAWRVLAGAVALAGGSA